MSWLIIACVSIVLAPLAASLLAYGWIELRTSQQRYATIDAVPTMPIALVLGTSPYYRNGQPNAYFEHRMDAAAQLYHQGRVERLLLSGSADQVRYNEPEEMALALEQRGVPRERMILDTGGKRTYDSIARTHEVYQFDTFIIVSQGFHNARALYLARKRGLTAIGFDAAGVRNQFGVKTPVREYLARVKAMYDVWLR